MSFEALVGIVDSNSLFQLGVSNVAELRQALGNNQDAAPKKLVKKEKKLNDNSQENPAKEEKNDELVYKDSSTFLKVGNQSTVVNKLRQASSLGFSNIV